jgi:hypothetical protein
MSNINLRVSVETLVSDLAPLASDIHDWEKQLALALDNQYKMDLIKDRARARADIDIRSNPTVRTQVKLTENVVTALVNLDPDVVQAEDDLVAAKLEVNNVKAIVNALDAKRSACKYLSELVLSGKVS